MEILEKINQAKIVVCCGSGGVGKTTISAALALYGALSGRKTLVLTIDPAKRLADSLGLSAFEYEEQPVPEEKFKQIGLNPSGKLFAMMLDTKRTFDRIVRRYSTSDEMKSQILDNRYYRMLSEKLGGSHEYMAMEKLYEIHGKNDYDLIVLDTPPTRQALDFLESPTRLADLFGNTLFWKIVKPYFKMSAWGFKMFSFFTSPFRKAMGMILGNQVTEDMTNFFQLGDDIFFDGFRERALSVRQLLSSPETVFLAISSPMKNAMKEAQYLWDKLKEFNMPFGGFIINRIHPLYPESVGPDHLPPSDIPESLMAKIIENFNNFQKLGKSERQAIENLKNRIDPEIPVRVIPCFASDVYDFSGLIQINQYLEGTGTRA